MKAVVAAAQIVGLCLCVAGFSLWLGATGGLLSAGAALFATGVVLERDL